MFPIRAEKTRKTTTWPFLAPSAIPEPLSRLASSKGAFSPFSFPTAHSPVSPPRLTAAVSNVVNPRSAPTPPRASSSKHQQPRRPRLHSQTATMASSIDVSSVSRDADSKHEPHIVSVLSNAINKSSPTEDSAETTASEIDKLYPTDSSDAEDWLWSFWTILVGVAKKIPADDERQQLLALTVAKLKTKRDEEVEMWGQKTRVWGELPMLGPVMRDAWNLSPDFDGSDNDTASIQEWVSLNSFAARLYGLSLQDWHNFAIWELRSGLEEAPEDRPNAKDTRIATAYEWITHAGKKLHKKGTEVEKLDAMETRALKPGSLFKSDKSGLTTERWNFWRERIGVLGAGAGSGAAKEKAQKALEKMKEIEG